MLPGGMGMSPPKTREYIKKMIAILEHGTHKSKERWIGHPSIQLKVFGPKLYLMTPPVQMTKPKVTSNLLPASSSISKLVPKETRGDAEDHQRIKLTGGGDARGLVRTDVAPINHFVQWFQAISANMNAEAQRSALSALWKVASSIFTNEGDDEGSSNVVKVAPV